ncbi:hypothetical protein AB0N14_37780 [Streptomyces sp. NPDC051104]|uniref:hypothetical protein n=1 Tax=Streptomyces sp. NPDC051104 TaxID=3155044 RepID=UPI00341A99E0
MNARQPPAPLLDAVLVVAALADAWVNVDVEEQTAMACALLAAFALTVRRHLPLTTFVLTLPTAVVTDAVFATMAALYTLSSLSRHRVLLVGCALTYAITDFLPWPWSSLKTTELDQTGGLVHLVLILNEAHARQVLAAYQQHHNERRPHQARNQLPPEAHEQPAATDIGTRRLQRTRILGGIINEYRYAAA